MRLLIDLGHTRLKWAWAGQENIRPGGALVWHDRHPATLVEALLEGAAATPVRVGVAAVARPPWLPEFLARLEARLGVPPALLTTSACCAGLRCGYGDPRTLGVDRWAAVVGAWRRAPGRAALVADAGSALTLDFIAPDGLHLGGSIAPGLALARSAFYLRTGRPDVAGVPHPDGTARSTADAVASGALLTVVGAIELAWRRFAAAGEPPLLWLTGGDAPAVSGVLAPAHALVPTLVFEGMDALLGGTG